MNEVQKAEATISVTVKYRTGCGGYYSYHQTTLYFVNPPTTKSGHIDAGRIRDITRELVRSRADDWTFHYASSVVKAKNERDGKFYTVR